MEKRKKNLFGFEWKEYTETPTNIRNTTLEKKQTQNFCFEIIFGVKEENKGIRK